VSPSEDATRDAYDAVAQEYEKQLADELDGKPLDRALLAGLRRAGRPGIVADVGCGRATSPLRCAHSAAS